MGKGWGRRPPLKALFFDVDGTLVSFQTHTVPQSALKALAAAREKGLLLFAASGRRAGPLRQGGALGEYPFDGFVTTNGQYCYTPTQEVYANPIPQGDIRRVVELLEEGLFPCLFVEKDRHYLSQTSPRVEQLNRQIAMEPPPVEDFHRALTQPVYQMNFFLTVQQEQAVLAQLPHCRAIRWNDLYSDIIPKEGNKWVGIQRMLAHFSLAPEEVAAFGDGENDLEMLRRAGVGVAMGNSSPQVQAAADLVTGSVEADGIAQAMVQLGIL